MDFKNVVWNNKTYKELLNYLNTLKDEKYKEFNLKIISTNYKVIGIRIPILRKIAKEISKSDFISLFNISNYENFEITLILGLLINYIDDYNLKLNILKEYILKIDNWAICDTVVNSLKFINKNKNLFFKEVLEFINSDFVYSERFGFVILLSYYITDEYIDKILDIIKNVDFSSYYVNMAISWLLCECFIGYKDKVYCFLKERNVNEFVLKKTISKIKDSYKVSKEDKDLVSKLLVA